MTIGTKAFDELKLAYAIVPNNIDCTENWQFQTCHIIHRL